MRKSDLADNWELRRLHNICEINPENLNISDYEKDFIEYIDISSINNETFLIDEIRKIPVDEIPSRARRVIRENDVIISTVRPYLQAFTKISEKDDGKICSTGFAVLRTKGEVYFDYLYHWVFSSKFMHFMISTMVGSNYPAVNMSDVKFAPIILPPYEEQIQIAKILTNVDKLIQTTQRLIEKLQECKKGIMQRLFSKGIGHSEFKDSILGKIPKSWELKKLYRITDLETGKRAKGGALMEGDYASIGGEHIGNDGNIIWKKMKFVPEDFYKAMINGKVHINDILINKDGALTGKTALVRNLEYKNTAINEHVFIIRIKDSSSISNLFLFYILFSEIGQRQIKREIHGLIPTLTRNDIKNILIPIPSLFEQERIGNILNNIDIRIMNEKKYFKFLKTIKKGLMQLLLTGKKRVHIKNTN